MKFCLAEWCAVHTLREYERIFTAEVIAAISAFDQG